MIQTSGSIRRLRALRNQDRVSSPTVRKSQGLVMKTLAYALATVMGASPKILTGTSCLNNLPAAFIKLFTFRPNWNSVVAQSLIVLQVRRPLMPRLTDQEQQEIIRYIEADNSFLFAGFDCQCRGYAERQRQQDRGRTRPDCKGEQRQTRLCHARNADAKLERLD